MNRRYLRFVGFLFLVTFLLVGTTAIGTSPEEVPYLNQINDTAKDFDGRWACGATSAVMILQYFDRLPVEGWYGEDDMGKYISKEYKFSDGADFYEKTNAGGDMVGKGAWGAIHLNHGPASKSEALDYFRKHNLNVEDYVDPKEEQIQKSLDRGNLIWASTQLSPLGHMVVITDYDNEGYFINDPMGNPSDPGYPKSPSDGKNVKVTWEDFAAHPTSQWPAKEGIKYALVVGDEGGPPQPPQTIAPGDESPPGEPIEPFSPTLTWEEVEEADSYALAISKKPYGSKNVVYRETKIYGTSHEVEKELEPDKKYRWNMQARNEAGLSEVSDDLYFQIVTKEIPDKYTLTVNTKGEGSVVEPGEGNFDLKEGEEVNLEAVPQDGWEFVKWTGDVDGTNPEKKITMDEGKEVTAVFLDREPAEATDSGYFIFGGSMDTIRGYNKDGGSSVVIPSQINGEDVKVIGWGAFEDENLTSVVIPDSVKVIEGRAFRKNDLASVEIGDNVEEIGYAAFEENKLTSIEIPNSVEEFGQVPFADNKLTSVKLPDGIEVIEWGAFYQNELTSVEIPTSVKAIKALAFNDNNLTSVDIPDGVEEIGEKAFWHNYLTSVKIPDGVEVIGRWAFRNNKLTSVEIPEGVDIADDAIYGNFKEVYNEHNKAAGVYVREDLYSDWYLREKKETDLHEETEIDATINRVKLEPEIPALNQEITLEMTFTNTGDSTHTFIAGASLWEPGSDFDSSYKDFNDEVSLKPGEEESIAWSYTVEIKGDWAYQFAAWKDEPSVEENLIEKSPSPAGYFSVEDHDPVEATDPRYFEFDKNTGKITGYDTAGGSDVVIPSRIDGVEVEIIGDQAFREKDLTSIELSDSVNIIERGAFFNNKLTSVEIPDSVREIREAAFYDNNLTSVELGDSVKLIEKNAFRKNALTSVEIPEDVEEIEKAAFYDNDLTSVKIGENVRVIGEYAFGKNNLTFVEIGDAVEVIGEGAFRKNDLASVEIPDRVKEIGEGAFSENDLTSVLIPNSVKVIGDGAFGKNNLTSVEFPNSVKKIGKGAFYDNDLTSVEIPDSVEVIEEGAFKSNNLTSVEIGDAVDVASNTIDGNFQEVHEEQNKAAGEYRREDTDEDWYLQGEAVEEDPEADPHNYFEFDKNTGKITGYDTAGGSDVVIPSRIDGVEVEIIGDQAFREKDLTSIELSDSVNVIERGAFFNNNLTSVEIPDSVREIREAAFGKNDLTSVELGDSVELIEKYAFRENDLASVEIPEGVEEIEKAAFYDNDLTSVEIGENVRVIGEYAFRKNNLTSVEIGDAVDVASNTIDGNFQEVHEEQNKAAGEYRREDTDEDWYLQGPVNFPDQNLEEAIRDAIDQPTGDIYPSDLERSIELNAKDAGIEDLTGIEHCEDLIGLNLQDNQISDVYPLSNLTNLEVLYLGNNDISDIQPLKELIELRRLQLENNQINNIQPLVGNDGLGDDDEVDLRENQLDLIKGSEDMNNIQTLLDRGVGVEYEPQTDTLAQIIKDHTMEDDKGRELKFPVTVDGDEYYIVYLEDYIDPKTWETEPVVQQTVFVDAQGEPISDEETVRKIAVIHRSRSLIYGKAPEFEFGTRAGSPAEIGKAIFNIRNRKDAREVVEQLEWALDAHAQAMSLVLGWGVTGAVSLKDFGEFVIDVAKTKPGAKEAKEKVYEWIDEKVPREVDLTTDEVERVVKLATDIGARGEDLDSAAFIKYTAQLLEHGSDKDPREMAERLALEGLDNAKELYREAEDIALEYDRHFPFSDDALADYEGAASYYEAFGTARFVEHAPASSLLKKATDWPTSMLGEARTFLKSVVSGMVDPVLGLFETKDPFEDVVSGGLEQLESSLPALTEEDEGKWLEEFYTDKQDAASRIETVLEGDTEQARYTLDLASGLPASE